MYIIYVIIIISTELGKHHAQFIILPWKTNILELSSQSLAVERVTNFLCDFRQFYSEP